jgi:patatin-like phospholipase/acyl hydrolase
MKRRVLSLDGGGVKGFVQIVALVFLEHFTGRRVYEMFDLIVGTSVGAIIASLLSTGKFSAKEVHLMMKELMPEIFKFRFRMPFVQPKYSKKMLKKKYDEILPNFKMKDAKVKLVITAYEVTGGRMHFYKSWEKKDGKLGLYDVVDMSSAAPTFFRQVVDKIAKLIHIDGGVTVTNNPSMDAYWEVKKFNWLKDDEVVCYSIGCGNSTHKIPYEKGIKFKVLRQALNFLSLKYGGLARKTVSNETNRFLETINEHNWQFKRFNHVIEEKFDKMDKVKFRPEYERVGAIIGDKIIREW